ARGGVNKGPATRAGPQRGRGARASVGAVLLEGDDERLEQDADVEPEGMPLDILDVVADALAANGEVLERAEVAADLGEAGDARAHGMALVVVRDQAHDRLPLDLEVQRVRPRADEAHPAAEHVPDLGQFVEAG